MLKRLICRDSTGSRGIQHLLKQVKPVKSNHIPQLDKSLDGLLSPRETGINNSLKFGGVSLVTNISEGYSFPAGEFELVVSHHLLILPITLSPRQLKYFKQLFNF